MDVIIVGGGLAGLAAARNLEGLDVLLVEAEDRLGGRLYPETRDGLAYELGALSVPVSTGVPFLSDGSDVGLFWKNELHVGPTPVAAITSADAAILPKTLLAHARPAVEAFFGVIHPGRIEEYLPQRQHDGLARVDFRRAATGNAEVLARVCEGLRATRRTARVRRVAAQDGEVEVALDSGDRLRARAAIVATDGAVAREILAAPRPASARLLSNLRYGGGAVVVLAVRAKNLPDLSYVVFSPEHAVRAIIRGAAQGDVRAYHCYLHGPPRGHDHVPAAAKALRRLAPGAEIEVVFTAERIWDRIGPIIDEKTYGDWTDEAVRPHDRIRLAGDYTSVDPADPLPYGLEAALASGRRAAEEIRRILG